MNGLLDHGSRAQRHRRIVKVVQSLVRRSDGAEAGEVVSTTGLMDLRERKLVADAAATWSRFLTDPSVVDLAMGTELDDSVGFPARRLR